MNLSKLQEAQELISDWRIKEIANYFDITEKEVIEWAIKDLYRFYDGTRQDNLEKDRNDFRAFFPDSGDK